MIFKWNSLNEVVETESHENQAHNSNIQKKQGVIKGNRESSGLSLALLGDYLRFKVRDSLLVWNLISIA